MHNGWPHHFIHDDFFTQTHFIIKDTVKLYSWLKIYQWQVLIWHLWFWAKQFISKLPGFPHCEKKLPWFTISSMCFDKFLTTNKATVEEDIIKTELDKGLCLYLHLTLSNNKQQHCAHETWRFAFWLPWSVPILSFIFFYEISFILEVKRTLESKYKRDSLSLS